MDTEIQIIEKPEWVPWDEIHKVLVAAHAQNRAKGINMRKPTLPGDEIAKDIGNRGKMFVAMTEEHVVGTLALVRKNGRSWYHNGEYGYLCYGAVLPEYGGKGIYRSLYGLAETTAKQWGLEVLTRDTNERNSRMLKITKQEGYHFVAYKACSDHFNIVRAKWLVKCPYPSWYIKIRFVASRVKTKIRYRMDPAKGRVKRFGI